MLKTLFINTLKLVIAGALIGWLVGSGKLDFKLLANLKNHLFALFSAVVLLLLNQFSVAWRWKNILKARTQKEFPFKGVIKINWIGNFFSSVLPGSVSGDLVKILYVQNYDPSLSKKFVLASIFIDRLMGLSGLILLVGFSSIFFASHIQTNAPAMTPLLNMNFILVGVVIISMIGFFIFNGFIRRVLEIFERFLPTKILEKLLGLWDDLSMIRPQMLKAVAISLLIQFTAVLVFWSLINPFVEGKMDFIQALAFIPIGMMTLALPIAPSGLGVGHAIFQKLFELSGITIGASLFNIYFVVTLLVNLLGAIPYVLNKRYVQN